MLEQDMQGVSYYTQRPTSSVHVRRVCEEKVTPINTRDGWGGGGGGGGGERECASVCFMPFHCRSQSAGFTVYYPKACSGLYDSAGSTS